MKHIASILLILMAFQISAWAQTKLDSVAIRQTVLDYIEGWDSGDSARMGRSLHHDLAKRGVMPSKDGKTLQIMNASYKNMVEWTLYQKNKPAVQNTFKDVIVIDKLGKNIASVTCISKEYIDYLHLVRTDKGWKILNVIWEPNYAQIKPNK